MNNPNQPKKHDAVLGGQAPAPINSVILGGIEGVQKRLATGLPEYQAAALNDALHYGDAGLKVILKSLQNTTGVGYTVRTRNIFFLWSCRLGARDSF